MAGGRLHLVAGYGREAEQSTEVLDRAEEAWRAGPDLPYRVGGGSCVAASPGRLLVSGGQLSRGRLAALDVAAGAWRRMPDLPRSRYLHGCAVVGGRYLVVAGGADEHLNLLR